MALQIGSIIGGIIVIYLGWYLHVHIFTRLKDLGVSHGYSYLDYFDSIFKSSVMAIFCARVAWIVMNKDAAFSVGFSFLPYERIGRDFEWLTSYPWRFLAFGEGVLWYVFWVVLGITLFMILEVPTLKLIRQLKIGKMSVKLNLILREVGFIVILALYLGFVAYISF